jgi:hypothetical protein
MNIDDMTYGELKQIAAMFGKSESIATEQAKNIPVVIWTSYRGVIFGYCDDTSARPIVLTNARMCTYWPSSVGGVFGLCDIGPNTDTKVSAVIPMASFEGVTGVATVTDFAENAWNNAKVVGRK